MTEHSLTHAPVSDGREVEPADVESAAEAPLGPIFPFPLFASGLYEWRQTIPPLTPTPTPTPIPIPPETAPIGPAAPILFFRAEELRLDVDGRYPQMTASGTLRGLLAPQTHWIASLTATAPNTWAGAIWFKDGATATFPYTNVEITVVKSFFPALRSATVTYSGGGALVRVRTFRYRSAAFHPVDFELDFAEGEAASAGIDTHAHPNRPATLPQETLTIPKVFQRAGFAVTTTPGGAVPITGAGPNARWSDQEMHDAMQTFWSRFAAKAQWAMWVFFASLHEQGTSLGGIMFDDIGPNHRQGTAIFNDSFIAVPPTGDPNPTAWVQRMIFWTACHEMGHGFNLAHSWQKSLVFGGKGPWIPLADEPEARSFMNYPFAVSGGQSAFFADFEYRFSDGELLFMRHAPARFVQQGNADWFDHHGFEQANVSPEPRLRLEVRVNREPATYEFMEPVTLELKLTNVSAQPQLVDANLLAASESLLVVLKKDGKPARQLLPYANRCWLPTTTVLPPGSSVYESLYVSSGRNGWDLAEPGYYAVQVAVRVGGEDVVSNRLRLRVAPPRGYDEEYLAQDFFSDDVGRIVALDGSRALARGNVTLREVIERLPDRRVALHAALGLAMPLRDTYKCLTEDDSEPRKHLGIRKEGARPEEARSLLEKALIEQRVTAVESLGHVDFRWYVDQFSEWLADRGDSVGASKVQETLYDTLARREVRGRGVLPAVLDEVKAQAEDYNKARSSRRSRASARTQTG
jgi:hypothetical protein